MENLIRIGVADSAEQVGIGEGPLERVILPPQGGLKLFSVAGENFQPSRVLFVQGGLSTKQVQRGPAFGPSLGQQQAACGKIKGCQVEFSRDLGAVQLPVQSSRNHEMQHQPELIIEPDGDPLAQPPQLTNRLADLRLPEEARRFEPGRDC